MSKKIFTIFMIATTIFMFINVIYSQPPSSVKIAGLYFGDWPEEAGAAQLCAKELNEGILYPDILPQTEIEFIAEFFPTISQAAILEKLIDVIDINDDLKLVLAGPTSSLTTITAISNGVYKIPQISHAASSTVLSDDSEYPLLLRTIPPDNKQADAVVAFLLNYQDVSINYDLIGVISTTDDYGVLGAKEFISKAEENGFTISSFQQFLPEEIDISVEIRELKNSGARIFVAVMLDTDFQTVIREADEQEAIGKRDDNEIFIWICFDGCATELIFSVDDEVDNDLKKWSNGMFGVRPISPTTQNFINFEAQFYQEDPNEIYGFGPDGFFSIWVAYSYDVCLTFAYGLSKLYDEGNYDPTYLDLYHSMINVTFEGKSGTVSFEPNGDRIGAYDIVNVQRDSDQFLNIATYDPENLLVFTNQTIEWPTGNDIPPDLDVRQPYDYWSCHDGKEKTDESGKDVSLDTSDDLRYENDPDNIASSYICDQFIDCNNMSDEGWDCNPSYKILFTIMGIITCLILFTIFIPAIFTIVFGCIIVRKRMKKLSPPFLLLMCWASFVGIASTFAWYGKPHSAACNFQLWLLAPALCLLVSSLLAKVSRIWWIFRSPLKRQRIQDWKLLIFVFILMAPCFLLCALWTLIATPMAKVIEVDGRDHPVCTTGGFINHVAAGYTFFGLMVAYIGILLLLGIFLYTMLRCTNVPSEYNEANLVGYTLYNLTFLGAVVIPVYFVIYENNPLAAWIIRTLAIMYAFLATLTLQFLPHMFVIIFINHFKDPPVSTKNLSDLTSGTTTGTHTSG